MNSLKTPDRAVDAAPPDRLRRGAAAVVLVALLVLVVGLLIPQPLRRYWGAVAILAWAGGGLAFGFATAREAAHRIEVADGIRHAHQYLLTAVRTGSHRVWTAVLGLPDNVMRQPATWPFLIAGGVISALALFGVLSVDLGATLLVWTLFACAVVYLAIEAVEPYGRSPSMCPFHSWHSPSQLGSRWRRSRFLASPAFLRQHRRLATSLQLLRSMLPFSSLLA